MSIPLIIEILSLVNTAMMVLIAVFVVLQMRAARLNLLAHRTRLEESITHLEKQFLELKSGSVVVFPGNHEADGAR